MKVFNTEQDQLPPNASAAKEAQQASRVLKGHHVPLVGDLLGRERVTGAKKTRAGCDLPTDRLNTLLKHQQYGMPNSHFYV